MGYYSSYSTKIAPRNADPEVLNRILFLKDECNISPNIFSFLSSLVAGYKKYNGITSRQYNAFCKIEKSYIDQKPPASSQWYNSYDDTKREKAKICALYYIANPPYYGDLAYRILNDKSFIPTENQYKSITENKYSIKVLESFYSEPRFKVNDYISLRKNHPYDFGKDKNLYVVVQIASEPIATAAKNTKKYKLLSIDGTNIRIVEERWLKFAKIK